MLTAILLFIDALLSLVAGLCLVSHVRRRPDGEWRSARWFSVPFFLGVVGVAVLATAVNRPRPGPAPATCPCPACEGPAACRCGAK